MTFFSLLLVFCLALLSAIAVTAVIFLRKRPLALPFATKRLWFRLREWEDRFAVVDEKLAKYSLSIPPETSKAFYDGRVAVIALRKLLQEAEDRLSTGEFVQALLLARIVEGEAVPEESLRRVSSEFHVPPEFLRGWEQCLENTLIKVADDVTHCSDELREAAKLGSVRRRQTTVMMSKIKEQLLKEIER